MNHTSHFKISAKNTLLLAFIFRGSLNSPLLALFSLIILLFLLNTLILLHVYQGIGETPYFIASFKLTEKHKGESDNFFMIYLQ